MVENGEFFALYTGDGSNKTWPYMWPASDANSMLVRVKDLMTGVITDIDPTEYTVNGLGEADDTNWTITYPILVGAPALSSNYKISIEPNENVTQERNFSQQGNNNPKVYGNSFDKLTVLIGQLLQRQERNLTVDQFSSVTDANEFIDSLATYQGIFDADVAAAQAFADAAEASALAAAATAANVTVFKYTATATQGQTAFDVSATVPLLPADANYIRVYADGVRQYDFTRTSDTVITTGAMSLGTKILIEAGVFSGIGAPQWGTIGGSISAQADLVAALAAKMTGNSPITGATKTKVTYDSKGLVTAGADATQDDIGDGTTYKQYSATEKTKLAGIETAADVTDAVNVLAAGAVMTTGDQTVAGIKTFSSAPILSTTTASELLATDSNKKPVSLAVATYPSPAEIAYVKGATSSIQTQLNAKVGKTSFPVVIGVACSDETTAITAGTSKVAFRAPFAFTLSEVRAGLTVAQASGSIFTVDVNEAGTSVLSTKLTVDNTEKTSTTAAAAPVISDSAIADDAEITVDVDQVGDGTAKGLKVWLIGTRTVS